MTIGTHVPPKVGSEPQQTGGSRMVSPVTTGVDLMEPRTLVLRRTWLENPAPVSNLRSKEESSDSEPAHVTGMRQEMTQNQLIQRNLERNNQILRQSVQSAEPPADKGFDRVGVTPRSSSN